MTRRLLFLNGLAILMIPIHHATAYGLQAMTGWAGSPDAIIDPTSNASDITTYYVVVLLRQLVTFAVPAFLFISGYFIAFMARGKNSRVTYKQVLPRIKILIPPFLIWTAARFALLKRPPSNLDEILNPYHFIPLLIQFYLLAPLLVPVAKKYPKLLLGVAAAFHLGIHSMRYVSSLGLGVPGVDLILGLIPRWIFLGQQPFWFPFGLVFGLHAAAFGRVLNRFRWQLLVGVLLFSAAIMVEYVTLENLSSNPIGQNFAVLTRNFYILFVILATISFDVVGGPLGKLFDHIGSRSLGIYMVNIPAIYVIARIIFSYAPQLIEMQLVYQTVLTLVGLGVPLVLMWFVRKTEPLRPGYRYLFG